jgi:hypothetical protein
MNLKEMDGDDGRWMELATDSAQWLAALVL